MRSAKYGDQGPEWIPRVTFTVIGCVLAVIATFWLVRTLKDLIAWVIISLFLSFALEPLTNKLEKRGWKRGRATGIILLATLLIFAVMLGSMVPIAVNQTGDLIKDAPEIVGRIGDFIDSNFGLSLSTNDLITKLTEIGSKLGVSGDSVADNVVGIGTKLIGGIFRVLTISLFTYYLVVDGPKVRRKVMAVMPARQQKIFLETWEIAIEKMGGYLYVRLILACLTAATAFVVMSIVKVEYALPLALWMGLLSQFIPVVGTYIGAAIPLVVALLGNPWSALVVLIYVILYQQLENYIISPRLTAKTMQLHPAIAIGAAIAGASIYGPIGAFLALPAAAILQVVSASYLKRHEVIDDGSDLLGVKRRAKKA